MIDRMAISQWVLVLGLVAAFFRWVWLDFNGNGNTEPYGFRGFLGSLFLLGAGLFLLWSSGALSKVIPAWY